MGLFGFLGKKPSQPASGGIETGIPAGAPPTQQLNPNTLGGLMPATPVIEKPASGDIEETGTWAAAKSALDAERVTAATASDTPVTSTQPMGTFGVSPTPEDIASVQAVNPPKINGEVVTSPASAETPLVSSPIETPADQFSAPVSETAETTVPDTGPSDEPMTEIQAPVVAPVSPIIEPTPPPFSMDALTAPQPEVSSTVQPETTNPVLEPAVAEPVTGETPAEAKTDGNDGLKPLDDAGAEQPAVSEPVQAIVEEHPEPATEDVPVESVQDAVEEHPEPASDDHIAPEQPVAEVSPAEPTPVAETPVEPSEEIPNNVVPFPAPVVTPAIDVPASEPTTEVAQTETTPEPAELPQAA